MSRPLLLAALCACTPVEPAIDPIHIEDDGGDPIVPELALLPWPSDHWLAAADTRTGWQIQVPAELLTGGMVPQTLSVSDGFSRVVPVVTWMPGGFDPSELPDPTDWSATTASDAPILLIAEDLTLVPLLAELDASTDIPDRQTLLLRPHRALAPDSRYAVLLTDALHQADGDDHQPSAAFKALRDGVPTDHAALEARRDAFELVLDGAAAHDLDPARLIQGFTFHTRSREQVVAPTLAIQDAMGAAPLDSWSLEPPVYASDKVLVRGRVELPEFLDADNRFVLGDDGMPTALGTREAEFLITIPRSVTEPRPPMLFGHGFFSAIEEPTWSNLFDGLDQWRIPAVSTAFEGFAEADLASTAVALAAGLNDLDGVMNQQLQSQGHFTVLHRLLAETLPEAVEIDLGAGPFHPLAPGSASYLGISNGGTQGLVLMSTSPALERGALVVAGGGWSHMLQRATQFNSLGALVASRFDDPRELQIAFSQLQQVFDPADSLNYVDRLIADRHPGRPDVDILLVEAIGDTQVSNMVTRWVAGNAGLPLLTPSPTSVWGVDEVTESETDGQAYVLYDLGAAPLPAGNVPPPEENGVHEEIRLLESYREQMGVFLETGDIIHPCDGPCDPL